MDKAEFEQHMVIILTAAMDSDRTVLSEYLDSIDLKGFITCWATDLLEIWDKFGAQDVTQLAQAIDTPIETILQTVGLNMAQEIPLED